MGAEQNICTTLLIFKSSSDRRFQRWLFAVRLCEMGRSLVILFMLASHQLSILCSPLGASTADLAVRRNEPPHHGRHPTSRDLRATVLPADLCKRTQPTVPPPIPTSAPSPSSINSNRDLFAALEQAGWGWRFVPHYWSSPSYTSSGFLVAYFDQCMAVVAARMLANAALNFIPVFFGANTPLLLRIDAYQTCPGCEGRVGVLTWELVYHLLLYMRNHAARGFTGTGTLYLSHGDDEAAVRMTLKLRDGYGEVVPQTCGAANKC